MKALVSYLLDFMCWPYTVNGDANSTVSSNKDSEHCYWLSAPYHGHTLRAKPFLNHTLQGLS